MRQIILIEAALVLLFCSCANQNTSSAAGQPHATVFMRDGTSLTGTVTASSPTDITLLGSDSVTRTIPMKQVKSVEYDDTSQAASAAPAAPASTPPPVAGSASPAATGTTPSAPTATTPQQSTPAPVPVAQAPAQPAEPEVTHQEHYHPPQSAIRTKTYRLPAGTQVSVRIEETIDSRKAAEGQTYAAEVTRDVLDQAGDVVIPRGSNAQIVIKSVSKGGRFHGASDLVLDLQSVSVEGQRYDVDAASLQERGKDGVGANRRTAEYTGGAAALGAIIGAIAGGGKGAAIGAGSGAGAGALTQLLTKGSAIRIPAETILTFKLDQPLRVVEAR